MIQESNLTLPGCLSFLNIVTTDNRVGGGFALSILLLIVTGEPLCDHYDKKMITCSFFFWTDFVAVRIWLRMYFG